MKTIKCKTEKELIELMDSTSDSIEVTHSHKDSKPILVYHAKGKNGEHLIFEKFSFMGCYWVNPNSEGPTRTSPEGIKNSFAKALYKLLSEISNGVSSTLQKSLTQTYHYIQSYDKYLKKQYKSFKIETNEYFLQATHEVLDKFFKDAKVSRWLIMDELIALSYESQNQFLIDLFQTIAYSEKETNNE